MFNFIQKNLFPQKTEHLSEKLSEFKNRYYAKLTWFEKMALSYGQLHPLLQSASYAIIGLLFLFSLLQPYCFFLGLISWIMIDILKTQFNTMENRLHVLFQDIKNYEHILEESIKANEQISKDLMQRQQNIIKTQEKLKHYEQKIEICCENLQEKINHFNQNSTHGFFDTTIEAIFKFTTEYSKHLKLF